jgi:hypothetical protein
MIKEVYWTARTLPIGKPSRIEGRAQMFDASHTFHHSPTTPLEKAGAQASSRTLVESAPDPQVTSGTSTDPPCRDH